MQQLNDNEHLIDRFLSPARQELEHCTHRRHCSGLSDWQWIKMGVERSLKDERSGRSFLQDWAMANEPERAVRVSHFFETLKSSRRLKLIEELSTALARSMPSHPASLLDQLEELDKVDVYAGDGHYHASAAHDQPIKGKRRAVGHFYTLNLRSHGFSHLTAADLQGGRKKSEHDMHALKRMSTEQLPARFRQRASSALYLGLCGDRHPAMVSLETGSRSLLSQSCKGFTEDYLLWRTGL